VKVIEEREGGIVRRVRLRDDDGQPVGPVCRFLDHLGDRGMSPNTVRAYGYDLRYLFTFLSREHLDYQDFRPPHALRLLAFLRRLPSRRAAQRLGLSVVVGGEDTPGRLLSPATVNRILAAVSSFYDWASPRSTTVTPRRCRSVLTRPWPGCPTGIGRSWTGPAVSSQSGEP
jgi:integrase/recombinase XerD